MLSITSLAAGSPAGQSADESAVKIVSVTAATLKQAKGLPMMTTTWETPGGVRLDFNGDSQANVILIPRGMNAYVLNPNTKQAFLVSGTSALLRQNLVKAPSPYLSHERRLASIDFLGYRCAVREGTQVLNGSSHHVQMWEAWINNRTETLRHCSQADDGSTMLIEAISVQVYRQTPPGLLDVPVGYTVTAMDAATEQKGTNSALSARLK